MAFKDYELLRNTFEKFMSEYANIYDRVWEENDWKNSFREIISKDIPASLITCADLSEPYTVLGSYGKGRWTSVPWIAIFDNRITTSAQKGVYIVYLLNKDAKELYLSFEIAATEVIGTKTDSKGNAVFSGVVGKNDPKMQNALKDRADIIRNDIPDDYFNKDNEIRTGSSGYDYGTVYYKKYTLEDLPDGEALVFDLKKMLVIYREYYEKFVEKETANSLKSILSEYEQGFSKEELVEFHSGSESKEESEFNFSPKEVIDHIKNYISSKGFNYSGNIIENFYLSLKSKPFAILAGTSGTGKTKLVELFAEAIGAEYSLVSVRPDWSDGNDLFGHHDLNGNFIEGPVCEAFDIAIADLDRPVLLCLDEMNLARVEYYLSDFLSVIESRKKGDDGTIKTKPIAQYSDGIPDNLYFVGTVNMDETTFPFSKKVLDRANTIEFNYVELLPDFDTVDSEQETLNVPNSFLKTEYLVLTLDCADEKEFVTKVCGELQKINVILREANAHVGYRVRDEIVFYMLNNKKAGNLLTEDEAMDNEIMQKILPRIQGSSVAIRDMLVKLFKFCMGNQSGPDTDSGKAGQQMQGMADSAKYKESARKIGYMMTRYEDDGFTSYWL